MKISDLSVGERINVKIQLSDGTLSAVSYTSKIEEILKNNEFLITSPTLSDMKYWIGKTVQIIVVNQAAVFSCFASVLEQKNDGNISLLHIKFNSEFAKEQRRSYFRLDAELDVVLDDKLFLKTMDISGGGISVKVKEPLPSNIVVSGSISIDSEAVKFVGNTIRSQRVSNGNSPDFFVVGIGFTDLDPWDQERILKYIHNQQVIMRRKGLLFGRKA